MERFLYKFILPEDPVIHRLTVLLRQQEIATKAMCEDIDETDYEGSLEDVLAYWRQLMLEDLSDHQSDQLEDPSQRFHFLIVKAEDAPTDLEALGEISFLDGRGNIYYTHSRVRRVDQNRFRVIDR